MVVVLNATIMGSVLNLDSEGAKSLNSLKSGFLKIS